MSPLEDLRRALRLLLKNPGFAVIAVGTLALGIAATTAIFSVVDGVLLKPLAFRQPERIVAIGTSWPDKGRLSTRVTGGDYIDLREQATTLDAISTYSGGEVGAQLADRAEFVNAYWVNRGYFSALDLQPAFGRLFLDSEANTAAVVSLAFASRNFGSGAAALGKTFRIEGVSYQITGVLPDHLSYPRKADVWLATPYTPENRNRTAYNYQAIGRIKPGVKLEAVQAQLATIGSQLEHAYKENKGKRFSAIPLQEHLVRNVRPTLYLLLGAVALVLLISCSNVANLLLARATGRAREIAVRSALGASRSRVVRELFTEGLVMALLAGVFGGLLAFWATDLMIRFAPDNLPRLRDVHVDLTMLAIAFGVSLLSSVLFGLVPAWQSSRVDIQDALKQGGGGKGSIAGGSNGLRSGLLVTQVALAFVLAAGAGVLFRSFVTMLTAELGYRKDNILVMYAHKPAQGLAELKPVSDKLEQIYDKIRALPGVQSVSATMGLPTGVYGSNGLYQVEGKHDPNQFEGLPAAGFRLTSPGFFSTLGIPLRRGRDFNLRDTYDSSFVAIVSDALVKQVFPNEDPLGRRIRCGLDSDKWMTVVGVVGDVRHDSPASAPEPELYMPLAQHPWHANEVQVTIATNGTPGQWTAPIRKIVRETDPSIATNFLTLDTMVSDSISAPRFRTFLVSLFAGVALMLAMAGIYGVMSYLVAQRTSEFGLRLALGATPVGVVGLVLRRTLWLVGTGLILGAAGAIALTRTLRSLVSGLESIDSLTLAAVALFTVLVSLSAAALPARRAAAIEPVVALRDE